MDRTYIITVALLSAVVALFAVYRCAKWHLHTSMPCGVLMRILSDPQTIQNIERRERRSCLRQVRLTLAALAQDGSMRAIAFRDGSGWMICAGQHLTVHPLPQGERMYYLRPLPPILLKASPAVERFHAAPAVPDALQGFEAFPHAAIRASAIDLDPGPASFR